MSSSPFQQRPLDPEWPKRVQQVTDAAAMTLGTYTVLVTMQEGGKLCCCDAGTPTGPETREAKKQMVEHPAMFFLTLARSMAIDMAYAQKDARKETKQ